MACAYNDFLPVLVVWEHDRYSMVPLLLSLVLEEVADPANLEDHRSEVQENPEDLLLELCREQHWRLLLSHEEYSALAFCWSIPADPRASFRMTLGFCHLANVSNTLALFGCPPSSPPLSADCRNVGSTQTASSPGGSRSPSRCPSCCSR